MHFIVDYENTDCRGLKGVQYLQKEDKPDIEQCILASNEPSERRRLIQSRKQILSLEQEYKKYTEHQQWKQRLEQLFSGSLEHREIEELAGLLEKKPRARALYLNLLKLLGKEKGLYVYRECKKLL